MFKTWLPALTLLALVGCAGQQEIVTNLSQNDANLILVVLQSQDIQAKKTEVPGRTVTYNISVSSSDANQALKILVANKLPKVQSPGLAEVYPIGASNLIPTASQEKAQFLLALQGEIENMLLILPGVVQARAVIVLPDSTIIRDMSQPAPQATASVAIVYNPIDNAGTPAVGPDDIKYLVASAVSDLEPSAVTVLMASNTPLRLVNSQAAPTVKASAPPPSAAGGSTSGSTTPSRVGSTGSTAPLQSGAPGTKEHSLITLFAGLAIVGLLLGVIALLRSMNLRSRLAKLQSPAPTEQLPEGEQTEETP